MFAILATGSPLFVQLACVTFEGKFEEVEGHRGCTVYSTADRPNGSPKGQAKESHACREAHAA